MDVQTFQENRGKIPRAELDKYRGQYAAWSPDGTRILAADKDMVRLCRTIREAGHDPKEILISMVPSTDTILGGGVEE